MPDHPQPPFGDLPEQDADPVDWDPATRRFVPRRAGDGDDSPRDDVARDDRRFYVGAPSDTDERSSPGAPSSPGARPSPAPAPAARPSPQPMPAPRPVKSRRGTGRRFPRVRARWVVLLCTLLPILLVIGGLLYADYKFRQIHRVPVGSLLDAGGSGTNILIVGSDTRADAASDAPNAGAILGPGAPTGQRSDTIMVLRLDKSGAHMLSIPRDLIVTIADTGKKDRINSSYNTDLGGGPARLLKTVKQSLGIPINRYMEVDFVTFAGLVDALGGVTINFPYPAFDDNSGLDVKQSGDVKLNGDQALAYVRSRHYTEIKEDGKPHEDPTADLGRVQRQQQFMRAVMGKVAGSRNPITLLRVGGQVASGLSVDDSLGLWGAMRLAWDLKGINPDSIALPVAPNSDNATLHLVQPDAQAVLAQFK